jgi:cystathionine beta-synthase
MPAQIYDDILGTMGQTPLVRLHKVTRGVKAEVIAKVEYFNPGGSIKDRIGVQIIDDAEAAGLLKPGGTIVEATSGNTGVGLAIVAAIRGYKTVFVMPDKMSNEKIRLLRAFGARVIVTPTNVEPEDPRSYYSVARQVTADTPNAILANQYHNPSNPKTHELTTGPEIWEQTGGRVDAVVIGMGTGGTITGIGRYLKSKDPAIQIVGVDPIGSILYDYFKTGQMSEAHTYKIEGIGEDFIPSNYDFTVIDEMVKVTDKESFLMTRRLVREEGIFAGISCGSALAGALTYVKQMGWGEDKRVVVILPDSGSRYLSKVFDDDWMRENGMLDPVWIGASVETLLDHRSPRQLIMATCSESVQSVIEKMRHYDISQLPVTDSQQELLGLVREVDLLKFMLGNAQNGVETSLEDAKIITSSIATVQGETPLEGLMEILSSGQDVAIVKQGEQVRDIITKIDMIDFLAKAK